MTARRGSLSYRIVRLARTPQAKAKAHATRFGYALLAARVMSRLLIVAAVIFVTGTISLQVWHASARYASLHDQTVQLERQNAALQGSNGALVTRITRLHDPEYLVPLIHEQLGLTKPNEVFVQLLQPTPAPAPKP